MGFTDFEPGEAVLCVLMIPACNKATVSFGSTEVCAEFATGQRAIFAAGSGTAVEAEIVLAVPFTASPLLHNTAAAAGRIVVIEQGGSALVDKAAQAQAAGAVGAIIVGTAASGTMAMAASGSFTDVRIPVVMVAESAAAVLQASQRARANIRATGAPAGQSTEA
jgi:hypothetical protein